MFNLEDVPTEPKVCPPPNVILQPVVRSIAQRPGTNILDIDFEVIDPDDDNQP